MIIRSPYPDIAIPEVCLPEFLFAELGTDDADRPAVIDTSHRGYTYGQLTTAIGRVAAAEPERVMSGRSADPGGHPSGAGRRR
ncbi:hypothetical protein [Streptomyces sp. SD15]